jgi:hypothetical protein
VVQARAAQCKHIKRLQDLDEAVVLKRSDWNGVNILEYSGRSSV